MKKAAKRAPDAPVRNDRLIAARKERYASAAAAAQAMNIPAATYYAHENGNAGLARSGERYARFFRVSLEWLLTGRGEMRPSRGAAQHIQVHGYVGAGGGVDWVDDAIAAEMDDGVKWPDPDGVYALIVKGESQYPRFLDGEIVLIDAQSVAPAELVGGYAVVQTEQDARRMIKILRRNPTGGDAWRLESHNAPPEDNVKLLAAWRVLGVLTRAGMARPHGRKR